MAMATIKSWWFQRAAMEKALIPIFCFLLLTSCVMLTVVLRSQQNKLIDLHYRTDSANSNRDNDIRKRLLLQLSPRVGNPNGAANRIKNNMKRLTKSVHIAGTSQNMDALDFIAKTYRNIGLDFVETPEYQVLLSYPDVHNPSKVWIDGVSQGDAVATLLGPPEAQRQENASAIAKIWWNAYAKSGIKSGSLVYANYGRESDFDVLRSHNISVNGTIVIMRYGHGWRGAKVYQAELNKAAGVILFSDPKDYVYNSPVYPNGTSMPSGGAQRGSLWQGDGDPLTPFYPAKPYTFSSITEKELRDTYMLPNIPVLPVSYGYARNILKSMDGPNAPENFQGALKITYKLSSSKNYKIQVNQTTKMTKIRNVVGYLVGQEEPDRWIILGNHVDAWTYGSQDPNSGTVSLMEVAHGIMSVANATGWRPRRSILFCSWDAEEYGLIGSNEWVEEYFKTLQSRAVAVLNVDNLKGNLSLDIKATPPLYRMLIEAASIVPNPLQSEIDKGRITILDSWRHYHNDSQEHIMPDVTMPSISKPGGGSDHKRFLMYVGVPIVYITYKGPVGGYPLYHTSYETEWTYENLVDANFTMACAVAQFWAEAARLLSDSLVIPFNVVDYAYEIDRYIVAMNDSLIQHQAFVKAVNANGGNSYTTTIANIMDASHRFHVQASTFQKLIDAANSGNPTTLRMIEMINSRLTMLERVFINPRGIPGRPGTRHVIYSDSVANAYAGETFSGVFDSLSAWERDRKDNKSAPEIKQHFRDIMTSINDIQYSLESAVILVKTEGFV